jgi:hypothetical protein
MKRKIFAATYHKTGTFLIKSILTDFCKSLCLSFANVDSADFSYIVYENVDVVFFANSSFRLLDNESKPFRLIRDPRDIVISSSRYHALNPAPEQWLNERKIGGKSYSEKMIESDDFLRIVIESTNVSAEVIRKIVETSNIDNMLTIKYEDLCNPSTLFEACSKIADHVGMGQLEKLVFMGCVVSNIPQMGVVLHKDHQTSNGNPQLWKEQPDHVIDYLNTTFGKEIIELGYSLDG